MALVSCAFSGHFPAIASVAELVDAADSKSASFTRVWVRVPPLVPSRFLSVGRQAIIRFEKRDNPVAEGTCIIASQLGWNASLDSIPGGGSFGHPKYVSVVGFIATLKSAPIH